MLKKLRVLQSGVQIDETVSFALSFPVMPTLVGKYLSKAELTRSTDEQQAVGFCAEVGAKNLSSIWPAALHRLLSCDNREATFTEGYTQQDDERRWTSSH